MIKGLSPRASRWVLNKCFWDEITVDELKARIASRQVDPVKHRNIGHKLSSELLTWAGIQVRCPVCDQPWPHHP